MLRTILVDDERPALHALTRLLAQYPEIEIAATFTDIEQALERVGRGDIQLVFLDIDMPKLNGIAAAQKIGAASPDVDIIFVTAYQDFAVAAFEVNAVDYVMKPVSKKRLDTTMERIVQKRLGPFKARQEQAVLLNDLIAAKITDPAEILRRGELLGLDLTRPCSFYFIQISAAGSQMVPEKPASIQPALEAFLTKLLAMPDLVAWQTPQGIGVLDFSRLASNDGKQEEIEKALRLKAWADDFFPGLTVILGIAARNPASQDFAARYRQARNVAVIGGRISPGAAVYHFLDSGFLPLLDQFVDDRKVDPLIASTIGKILEYDRVNGAELFSTLEKILISDNLREVAQALFIHYKTVLFRKNSIEKILGISLNSFSGRTILGVALTLYYLRGIPSDADA